MAITDSSERVAVHPLRYTLLTHGLRLRGLRGFSGCWAAGALTVSSAYDVASTYESAIVKVSRMKNGGGEEERDEHSSICPSSLSFRVSPLFCDPDHVNTWKYLAIRTDCICDKIAPVSPSLLLFPKYKIHVTGGGHRTESFRQSFSQRRETAEALGGCVVGLTYGLLSLSWLPISLSLCPSHTVSRSCLRLGAFPPPSPASPLSNPAQPVGKPTPCPPSAVSSPSSAVRALLPPSSPPRPSLPPPQLPPLLLPRPCPPSRSFAPVPRRCTRR